MNWRTLDFAPRLPWRGVLVLVAAALVLTAGLPRWLAARDAVARASAQADERARLAAPAPVTPPRAIPRERAAAINGAVAELNQPWAPLLRALDHARPADVALVSLQPGEPSTRIRMTLESSSLDSLARFVAGLRGQPPIRGVLLRRQERLDPPSEARFRLTVDLEWQ